MAPVRSGARPPDQRGRVAAEGSTPLIEVDIPGADVEGEIFTLDDDIRLLEDGMLHVSIDGFSIDVSWCPEHDPEGEYLITIYRGAWENQLGQVRTRDPCEAAEVVRLWAEHLHQGMDGP